MALQSPPTAIDASAPIELRFAAPPPTSPAIKQTLADVQKELDALAPTTQPAGTQPASQPTTRADADPGLQLAAWRLALWDRYQEFRAALSELDTNARMSAELAKGETDAALRREIEEWKRRTAELAGLAEPYRATEAELAEADAELEKHARMLDALTATITELEASVSKEFRKQRAELDARLKEAQSEKEQLDASFDVALKAADSEVKADIIRTRRRAAAARVAGLLTSRAALDAKEKLTSQNVQAYRLRRDALKPLVDALRRRATLLKEVQSRSEAERLARRLKAANLSPAERSFLKLSLLREQTVQRLSQEFTTAIHDRFPASDLQELVGNAQREQAYWKRLTGSLSRRPAGDVLQANRAVRTTLSRAVARLAELHRLLDTSVSEQRSLEQWQDRVHDESVKLAQEFKDRIGTRTDADAIEMMRRVPELRKSIDEPFVALLREAEELIGRLNHGIDTMENLVKTYEAARSRLYWARLFTRGHGWFDADRYDALPAEWRGLVRGGGLVKALGGTWSEARQAIATTRRGNWIAGSAAAVIALVAMYWVRRRSRAVWSRRPVEDAARPEDVLPFAGRLQLQTARVAPDLMAALAIPVVAVLAARAAGLSGRAHDLLATAIGWWTGIAVAEAVIRALFHQSKARYRVIPCSNAVARFYRRGMRALLAVLIVFGIPATALAALNLGPVLRELLLEWGIVALTLGAFVFLLWRDTVLGIFPRERRRGFAPSVATLRAVHVLLLIVTFSLIVLHLAGYEALAWYVSTGLTTTVAGLALGWLVDRLVRDFVRWIVERAQATSVHGPSLGAPVALPGSSPAPEGSEKLSARDVREVSALARLVLAAARLTIGVAVTVVVLIAWGVRPYEVKQLLDFELWSQGGQPVTAWRIGSAVLSAVAAVLLSRVLRQTLNVRVYPRHPGIDRGAQAAINALLHYTAVVVGVYVGLQLIRIDLGALAVLFGGLGLGLGLGLQPLVVNFFSGLMMFVERHVRVGDTIIYQGQLGEVTRVSMRSTTIRTPDGTFLVVPNGDFVNQKVENWTLLRQPIRGTVEIGVGYNCDPGRVKALLEQVAANEPRVLKYPAPEALFVDFGESALMFRLLCWFSDPASRWYGMVAMRHAIVDVFRKNGIEIPFPQRTLSFAPASAVGVRMLEPDERNEPSDPPPPKTPA